jgi:hypothetical protein
VCLRFPATESIITGVSGRERPSPRHSLAARDHEVQLNRPERKVGAVRVKFTTILAALIFAGAFAIQPSLVQAAAPPERNAAPSAIDASPLLTVPAETEASVLLLSGIHTKISEVHDQVEGQLLRPVYVGGQLALPQGTLLFGRVTHVRAAGRMHRPAEIGFRFDEVYLPDGETEPVTARLAALESPGLMRVDREGDLKGGRQFSWHLMTGSLIGAGGLAAIPRVAGATAAASAGSIAAAGIVGCLVLLPHGPEVHLPPDTRCRVRFDYSFTVRGQS